MTRHPDGPLFADSATTSKVGLRGLPADLLRDASRRLITLAVVCGLLGVFAILMATVVAPLLPELGEEFDQRERGVFFQLATVFLVLSLAVIAVARSGKLPPVVLLDLGLGRQPMPVRPDCEARRAEIGQALSQWPAAERRDVRQVLEPVGAWHAMILPPLATEIDPGDPRRL